MSKAKLAPQKGSQELAMNTKADVIIYGGSAGSGKSHLLLMHPLQHVHDPNFEAVFFRRVTTQLIGSGGLWPESKKMYSLFKTSVRTKPQLQHTFPKGATISFTHMQHEDDKISHQGLQYSAIFFDELTHFSETQFTYLLSRLRSSADGDSYCMASCNPDADSWVLKWIEWWLDEDGYPDKSKQGKIRYYVVIEDQPIFADTKEELIEQYSDYLKIYNPIEEKWVIIEPKSLTFVSGTIFDNPALIAKNPKYLAELNALPKLEKARLLHGNWYARPEGSNYFNREWLHKVDTIPPGCVEVRAWDKASSEPSDTARHPDYTACIKMVKSRDGRYYILGDFSPTCKEDSSEIYGRFRKRPGDRDRKIEEQAAHDGVDCLVVLPIDPGSAGRVEFTESSKKLVEAGFRCSSDPMPNNKSKLKRFEPFSSAAQNGLISIVENSFPNKATLEVYYKELEAFNGERSTSARKDDYCDATASAFNKLAVTKSIPKFSLPSAESSHTRKHEVMGQAVPNFNR